jgi:sec-independent protein translocase protein TatA
VIPGIPQIGATELIILLVIILLLFGAKRIPELARSLGKGTREYRKGISGAYDEIDADEGKQEPHLAGDAPTQEVHQR